MAADASDRVHPAQCGRPRAMVGVAESVVGAAGERHSLPVGQDRGVGSWIERRARVAPDRPALIHGETRRTYGELSSRVRRLAHGLRFLGVVRGDRVGWLGADHPAFLEVLFAAARVGAAVVPVNHRLDAAVIDDVVHEFSPTVVVVEQNAAGIPLPSGIRARVVVGSAGATDVDYELLVAHSPDAPVEEVTQLEDLCLLPHTSGTTGRPKGVMLTHGNVTWNIVNLLSVVDFRTDDVTIAIAPFFRTGGTGVNVLPVRSRAVRSLCPSAPTPTRSSVSWRSIGSPSGSGIRTCSSRSRGRRAGPRPISRASASSSRAARPSPSVSSGCTSNAASRFSRATGCRRRRRSYRSSTPPARCESSGRQERQRSSSTSKPYGGTVRSARRTRRASCSCGAPT